MKSTYPLLVPLDTVVQSSLRTVGAGRSWYIPNVDVLTSSEGSRYKRVVWQQVKSNVWLGKLGGYRIDYSPTYSIVHALVTRQLTHGSSTNWEGVSWEGLTDYVLKAVEDQSSILYPERSTLRILQVMQITANRAGWLVEGAGGFGREIW